MILGNAYDNPQNMDDQHRFALAFLQQQQQQQMNAAAMHSGVDPSGVNMHGGVSVSGASGGWGHLAHQGVPTSVGLGDGSGQDLGLGSLGNNSGMLTEETRKRQLQEILQQIMTITEQSLDAAQARFVSKVHVKCELFKSSYNGKTDFLACVLYLYHSEKSLSQTFIKKNLA